MTAVYVCIPTHTYSQTDMFVCTFKIWYFGFSCTYCVVFVSIAEKRKTVLLLGNRLFHSPPFGHVHEMKCCSLLACFWQNLFAYWMLSFEAYVCTYRQATTQHCAHKQGGFVGILIVLLVLPMKPSWSHWRISEIYSPENTQITKFFFKCWKIYFEIKYPISILIWLNSQGLTIGVLHRVTLKCFFI